MADLQADFEAAVANSRKLSQRPDNATQPATEKSSW